MIPVLKSHWNSEDNVTMFHRIWNIWQTKIHMKNKENSGLVGDLTFPV